MFMRTNMFIQQFHNRSVTVKLMLFKFYCSFIHSFNSFKFNSRLKAHAAEYYGKTH